jgi:radical SAM superfamily enzyme YgiQ (UPF0313 family)
MVLLVNTNRIRPPIAPVGLEHVASSLLAAGERAAILDLGLAEDWKRALRARLSGTEPELIGLSFRNSDDSFWPSATWFVPLLLDIVLEVRRLSHAPVVVGGAGFSLFPDDILAYTGADYGVAGDGEGAIEALLAALRAGGPRPGRDALAGVPGLVWRDGRTIRRNAPHWPPYPDIPVRRDLVDNREYLRLGAQVGLETKRGCPRRCVFCADCLAKGSASRLRPPERVADEAEALLAQGVDVIHLCDAEFNQPLGHALGVCEALSRRGLGGKFRWYAYLAVTPFLPELAAAMRRAGCLGINFTGISGSDSILEMLNQPHRVADLEAAVRISRDHGIAVMVDLLLGGPGETPATVADGIAALKRIGPDCAGAALGVRLYPGLPITDAVAREHPLDEHPGVQRRYEGPVDLVKPTFYISPALGPRPAALIRDAIAGDHRFFPPSDLKEAFVLEMRGYNYNENVPLQRAIEAGARGAYWDILRGLK